MSNSKLVDVIVKSPNHSGRRTHAIKYITPHCVVGQLDAKTIGACFPKGRGASCNYGIGKNGDVVLVVDEENRSWCTSSSANDNRAVTIECASDMKSPYAMNSKVYNKLVDLCVDICRRNGKKKLLWIPNKTMALAYKPKKDEMLITVHRWFANKECPGNWLYSRLGKLATTVTERLNPAPKKVLYKVQVGAYSKAKNANDLVKKLKAKKFEGIVVKSGSLYKVQVGVYRVKANAYDMLKKVKAAGFDGIIVKVR